MRTSLKTDFSKLKLRTLYPVFIIWLINLIMIIAVITAIFRLVDHYTQYAQLRDSVDELQIKVNLVNENRKIDQAELDNLNQVLSRLIPDNEDYFLVISALEKLASETGFSLARYTINISASTAEKLSLSIDGSGDSESFLKLLNTYQYGGGRLITNESLEFSPLNFRSVRLSLNFYHKQPNNVIDVNNNKISEKDMLLIKSIVEKMNRQEVQVQ